jgi:hypothetical protein
MGTRVATADKRVPWPPVDTVLVCCVQVPHDGVDKKPGSQDDDEADEGVGKYLMRFPDITRITRRHDVEHPGINEQYRRHKDGKAHKEFQDLHRKDLGIARIALATIAYAAIGGVWATGGRVNINCDIVTARH